MRKTKTLRNKASTGNAAGSAAGAAGKPEPLVIVLSGPSGAGKDAVLHHLREKSYPAHFTITATTRPKRPTEVNGRDYFFVSTKEFLSMKSRGELLESAQVYGHYYGVPREQVKQALAKGKDVFIKVDVQGAATLRSLLPEAVFIFIAPSSPEELASRLKKRNSERLPDLSLRLKTAEKEMADPAIFDYKVVNADGKLADAVSKIAAIITAEKRKTRIRAT